MYSCEGLLLWQGLLQRWLRVGTPTCWWSVNNHSIYWCQWRLHSRVQQKRQLGGDLLETSQVTKMACCCYNKHWWPYLSRRRESDKFQEIKRRSYDACQIKLCKSSPKIWLSKSAGLKTSVETGMKCMKNVKQSGPASRQQIRPHRDSLFFRSNSSFGSCSMTLHGTCRAIYIMILGQAEYQHISIFACFGWS